MPEVVVVVFHKFFLDSEMIKRTRQHLNKLLKKIPNLFFLHSVLSYKELHSSIYSLTSLLLVSKSFKADCIASFLQEDCE